MKQGLYIICVFIFSIQQLSAQDVKVSATIDKQSYVIGDYIRLRIDAVTDSSTNIFWPRAEDIASFDIISTNPVDTLREQSNYKISQVIVYSIYDSGVYTLPIIRMEYKKAGDQLLNSVYTDSIRFTVHTVPVDTTQTIKPIKGNIEVEVKNYLWLYILIGVLVLATIGLGIYFTFFTKKSIKTILPKSKPKPLHELTIEKLNALDQKKLWQQDEIKLYYSELTEILRSYLEKRFTIHAMESTSDEIMDQLSYQKIHPQHLEQLAFILEVADMAKFAKSKPLPNDNTMAMTYAINFVEATKPIEIIATENT